MKNFDEEKNYNLFNSSNFVAKTFSFNTKNDSYDEIEKYFFDNIQNGYWVTKGDIYNSSNDKLYNNVSEIKEKIQILKNNT